MFEYDRTRSFRFDLGLGLRTNISYDPGPHPTATGLPVPTHLLPETAESVPVGPVIDPLGNVGCRMFEYDRTRSFPFDLGLGLRTNISYDPGPHPTATGSPAPTHLLPETAVSVPVGPVIDPLGNVAAGAPQPSEVAETDEPVVITRTS
jgi:hypothetical protein